MRHFYKKGEVITAQLTYLNSDSWGNNTHCIAINKGCVKSFVFKQSASKTDFGSSLLKWDTDMIAGCRPVMTSVVVNHAV